jgi:hypothetical protein
MAANAKSADEQSRRQGQGLQRPGRPGHEGHQGQGQPGQVNELLKKKLG